MSRKFIFLAEKIMPGDKISFREFLFSSEDVFFLHNVWKKNYSSSGKKSSPDFSCSWCNFYCQQERLFLFQKIELLTKQFVQFWETQEKNCSGSSKRERWLCRKSWLWQQRSIFFLISGILLPKLLWPTVRKKYSSYWEKLLKFEAEGREFANFLRSLEQFTYLYKQ